MKIFGSIFLFFIYSTQLFGINAYLKEKTIYEGESASLVIHIEAKKINLKKLNDIAGLPIVEHKGESKYKIINGKKIKDIHYEVVFYPKENMIIPPLAFIIDGKREVTKPIKVTLKKNPNNLFTMKAFVNKNNPFQNEIIKYSLHFKYKNDIKLADYKFIKPDFAGFWLESIERLSTKKEGGFTTHRINYYLTAKETGELTIKPGTLEADQKSTFNSLRRYIHTRTFDSNSVSIEVKALPPKIDLLGKFGIKTLVNKNEMEGNGILKLLIKIEGIGNVADIKPFSLNIKEAMITKEEPIIQKYSKNDNISGNFMQYFSITNAKKDFNIPSFELKYYDLNTNSIKTVKSEPIKILVNNPIKDLSLKGGKEELKIENKEKIKEGLEMNIISILLGFLLGATFIISIQTFLKKKKSIKLYKYSNEKVLLQKLFSYKGLSENIDRLIIKLEKKLYLKQKVSISKKEIKIVQKEMVQKNNHKLYK